MYLMVREGFVYAIRVDIYAFRLAFSTKTHYVLLQMAQKRVLMAVGLNKYSFRLHV